MSSNQRHTAIYLRVSTNNGTQVTDSQLDECSRFCQGKNWANTVIYEDKVSGTKASRPALDRLVKKMREGAVERVVIYKLCRLGTDFILDSLILRFVSSECLKPFALDIVSFPIKVARGRELGSSPY